MESPNTLNNIISKMLPTLIANSVMGEKVSDDELFKIRTVSTEIIFVLYPKRCYLSKKWLWLTFAYRQTAIFTGPDMPMFEHRWYNKNEYVFAKLKGIV